MNKTQQGRSMIEMLGVLAIVGVLSVGGIMAYNMAMNKFKTNKQMDQIQLIMTNIKTLYASNSNYNGLNNGVLIALGVLTPRNAADAATAATAGQGEIAVDNAFGGDLTVQVEGTGASYALGDAANDGAYSITITNIPKSACAVIANNDWGGSDSGLLDFMIEGSTIYTGGDKGFATRKNIGQLAALCQGNTTLTWYVK